MKNNQIKYKQHVALQHVVEASSKTCRCCRFLARSSPHSADATTSDDRLDQLKNSFANASSSIMAAKMQGNIIDTLMPPLTPNELVIAYSSGGATRGVTVGIVVGAMMSLFADLQPQSIFYIVFYVISAAYMLAMLGVIGGIWADRQDHMTVVNGFIITPLSFLSGTFYSIDRLPETFQAIALFNPFFYAIDGLRAGFTGQADGPLLAGALVLMGMNICLWLICRHLFTTGYKLKA